MAYIDRIISLDRLEKIDEKYYSYDIIYESEERSRRLLPMWEEFIRYDIRKHPKLKINLDNKTVYFVFPGIPQYYDKNKKELIEPKYISDDFQSELYRLIDFPVLKPEMFITFAKEPFEYEDNKIKIRSGVEGYKWGIPTWSGWDAYTSDKKYHSLEDFKPSIKLPWTLHNNSEYYLYIELEVKDDNIEIFFTNDGWDYFRTIMYVFSREE